MRRSRVRSSARTVKAATDLMLASWETILRRTMMMGTGACSPAEYRRMVREKADALRETMVLTWRTGATASASALMAPWRRRAAANAKRLRRKQR